MRIRYLIIVGILLAFLSESKGQSYEIGYTSLMFFDQNRNRDIETKIYYPSDISGEDEAISKGSFPVIVFGHGFLMNWSAYENFWTELVPNGFVMCFPTTESGLNPSHENLGLDLKFIAEQFQNLNRDSSSLFYNSISEETGIMGHSMGGGASFLAAENNQNIHTLVNFAAAETTPSAITAAANISVPTLIFSGEEDCVTPPENHQDLMYDSLNAVCKTQIKIKKGGHCNFAENNFTCNLGETFCGFEDDISRAVQQSITFGFLKLWLEHTLQKDQNAFEVFNDSLNNSGRINFSQDCKPTSVQKIQSSAEVLIFPNPFVDTIQLIIKEVKTDGCLQVFDVSGKKVFEENVREVNVRVNLSNLPKGQYLIVYNKGEFRHSETLTKS